METATSETTQDHLELVNEVLHYTQDIKILRPATIDDGIIRFSKRTRKQRREKFKKKASKYTFCNFIPASGSGSRMFKDLERFVKDFNPKEESFSSYVNSTSSYALKEFFQQLKHMPFYNDIPEDILYKDINIISHDEKKLLIANFLTDVAKLQEKPKALQKFHLINGQPVSALEQQMRLHVKLIRYFEDGMAHFTISRKHEAEFKTELSNCTINSDTVSTSKQSQNSDAYCLDKYNNLYTESNGTPLKKPSGHGALLENLSDVECDIIHIHNIDNIPHKKHHKGLVKEKMVLAGHLIFLKERISKYLKLLEEGELKERKYKNFKKFCQKHLITDFESYLLQSKLGLRSAIYRFLNRPIRLCAMVPTENHSGGGPYWVEDNDGHASLQIVESIEIDKSQYHKEIVNSTHFNPVEIFCSAKDYKGNEFNLEEFVNHKRKMLVSKTHNGDDIKFFEKPGLWNGAMHNWLTVFIEMDGKFFNPVKCVTDLLHPNHQE